MKLAIKHLKWYIKIYKDCIKNCKRSINSKIFDEFDTEKTLKWRIKSYQNDIKDLKQAIKVLKGIKG